jgi:hypothetical protein
MPLGGTGEQDLPHAYVSVSVRLQRLLHSIQVKRLDGNCRYPALRLPVNLRMCRLHVNSTLYCLRNLPHADTQ